MGPTQRLPRACIAAARASPRHAAPSPRLRAIPRSHLGGTTAGTGSPTAAQRCGLGRSPDCARVGSPAGPRTQRRPSSIRAAHEPHDLPFVATGHCRVAAAALW